tara:strand:+ start:47 stop:1078 length:1032 start_codon:yes stop_codon:yes gene_type:complete
LLSDNYINDRRTTAITRAIEKVGPSVASINVLQKQKKRNFNNDPFLNFFLNPDIYPMKNSGSGVVISPDGYVITNNHVINNASKITVTLSGGDEYDAEIIGKDERSDLALLKIDGPDFPYAILGNSKDLIIGEWVIALGNPFELFTISNKPTASVGIVSANHMDFGLQKDGKVLNDMIQTDAAINPGNSGGPLVNALGEVIGINQFIYTGSNYTEGSIGIGFAIPINTAINIAEELKINGSIDRRFSTGLIVQPLTKSIRRYYDIPFKKGLIITDIEKNSMADLAKLEIGDIIVNVESLEVSLPADIRSIIIEKDLRSGDLIKLKIYRNDKYRKIKMKLGSYN